MSVAIPLEELIPLMKQTRREAGLTQKQVAERMHCSQSKVSKMECSEPGDLIVLDLRRYFEALGGSLEIELVPGGEHDQD